MELYEVMRTTFAAREFTDQQVSDETIAKILEEARFAPSGGNRQGWKVLVVREASSRARLRELIEPQMQRYVAQVKAGEAPMNTIHPSQASETDVAATQVPAQMLDNLTGAPVILLVFVDPGSGHPVVVFEGCVHRSNAVCIGSDCWTGGEGLISQCGRPPEEAVGSGVRAGGKDRWLMIGCISGRMVSTAAYGAMMASCAAW